MEIKILENNIIIIDRKDIERKFVAIKDNIKGTFIENYFVYESYVYYDELENFKNYEIEEIENNMQFYNEFTNFEDLLKSIQEEN